MFTRFDTNKSTKGASKLRRDLINAEIANLRDLLPLPQSTRQRLSQLQLMALVCVYVRKANYFQQVFKRHDIALHQAPTPNIGFSKALSGFLMMLTQNGKLLYISDNAAEYLGHSMEDLLIHGDSVYDIIDKQDHGSIQAELGRNVPQQTSASHHTTTGTQSSHLNNSLEGEHRMFLCRMNVSRNARRQMRFGDQKVVLVQGHYLSYLPLCSRNEPVFLATCTPIAMPETRECVVQGATNVFTTIHSMDMKIVHIDKNGEFHLGYSRTEIQGISWYRLLHWDSTREAQNKHRLITQSEQDRSCILLIQMERRQGDFIWVHAVLQVRDSQDTNQQPVIVCTNQVLSDREASVMLANSWLYHYYSVQSKIQFGLPFDGTNSSRIPPTTTTTYYINHNLHPSHQHQHHHHNHQHSPTLQVNNNLTHPFITSHYQTYGYHSPIGISQGGPPTQLPHHHHQNSTAGGLITQQNGTTTSHESVQTNHQLNHLNMNGKGGNHNYRSSSSSSSPSSSTFPPYSFRIDTQPVDYSHTTLQLPSLSLTSLHHFHNGGIGDDGGGDNCGGGASNNGTDSRCNSTNSLNSDNPSNTPPHKKRAIARLEPLYIPENVHHESSDVSILELHSNNSNPPTRNENDTVRINDIGPGGLHESGGGGDDDDGEGGGTLLLSTIIPARHQRLYNTKGIITSESPELMDQWNPSPPWSESAQKVPDMTQPELSPYLTTTPPTPTSAPLPSSSSSSTSSGYGAAFSFDWMPEQFLPIMDCTPCVPCLTQDGLSISVPVTAMPLTLSHHHWPPTDHHHHHRLLSLQPANLIERLTTTNNDDGIQNVDVREQRRSH